ncbi:hypothetical protein C8F01DRAFT_1051825 [Mycena amicta]|nr:hypothetical protein C8F01DRAFT_1051825 [Mycena amicta]
MSNCTDSCSAHCTASKAYAVPDIPHPDLLLNNDAVPDDIQVHEIRLAIANANRTVSSLDDEISSLHQRIVRLNTQRTQLEYFISTQSAIISGIRRLSNEILLEIFSYCTNPVYPPFHKYNPISKLLLVSSRWRAVAIAFPGLWRNVTFTGGLQLRTETLTQQVALQIERANQAPLSILLRAAGTYNPPFHLLDLVISASARWQKADIYLSPSHLQHLFKPLPVFGMLTKLSLVINVDGVLETTPEEFLTLFPSLVELALRMGSWKIPQSFDLLWKQLRQCRLEECGTEDVLKILPVLSQDCQLVLKACGETNFKAEDHDSASTTCRVSALSIITLHSNDAFFSEMLNSILTTPNLERLCIPATNKFISSTRAFLGRSSCTLSHLRLQTREKFDPDSLTLIDFLASPELYELQHLDLILRKEWDAKSVFDLLLKAEILPHLETLTIRDTEVDLAWVLGLQKARKSVLRRLGVPPGTAPIPKESFDGFDVYICSSLGPAEDLIPVAHATYPARALAHDIAVIL